YSGRVYRTYRRRHGQGGSLPEIRLTRRGNRYPQTPINFIGFSRFELKKMPAEYEPTAEQRALVESASAIGITQAEIANQLKIDEKTLRKHFREELSSGKFKVYPRAAHCCTKATYARTARNRCWRQAATFRPNPPPPPGRESLPAARAVALPARSCGLPGYLAQRF